MLKGVSYLLLKTSVAKKRRAKTNAHQRRQPRKAQRRKPGGSHHRMYKREPRTAPPWLIAKKRARKACTIIP